jgi:hypothetical protein
MMGVYVEAKLLTSWWPGNKRKKKEGPESQYLLQGHVSI